MAMTMERDPAQPDAAPFRQAHPVFSLLKASVLPRWKPTSTPARAAWKAFQNAESGRSAVRRCRRLQQHQHAGRLQHHERNAPPHQSHHHRGRLPIRALTVEEAQRLICERIAPVGDSASAAAAGALDRVLAADIISPINVPAHDNSAMDGYACAAPTCRPAARALRSAGVAYAGHPFAQAPQAGECVRIMTGAAMPPGCDTVLPQELAAAIDDRVTIAPTPSAPAPTCAAPAKTCARAASPSPPASCCARRTWA
jgi:molybdopterin molybdotransferase